MEDFREALDDCGLEGLGYLSLVFTWCNKREGGEMVQERNCAFLDSNFLAEEVKKAVFDMYPTKAPGLDGTHALLYQTLWHIVGLQSSVDEVISDTKSAFIPGCLISDNAIVGFECVHALRTRKNGKKWALAIKLDMSKAYDRDKWEYIWGMMSRLRFSLWWIDRIMRCVMSISFSFMINGEVQTLIKPFGGWDVELIRRSFNLEDASHILSLPFSSKGSVNSLLWHYEKLENYSVQSGYRLSCSLSKVSDGINGKMGICIIVRNAASEVLASSPHPIVAGYNAQISESVTILRGLKLGISLGLVPCAVESDALSVVTLTKAGHAPCVNVGLIIHDLL
ncbi:hypothetical protein Dsin_001252 [Dipteronia sinensis]|uniref:Reverse transcriptase n=1 Tax=Dipteronia sinensis TaxID=43782 RepID=A0AAE0EIA1_9ROSI|nr:hypothetical protein Dsin_001252 [Dipteronia sinensis]